MIQFIVRGENVTPLPEFKKLNNHFIADYEVSELTNEKRAELKHKFPQGYFRIAEWERGGGTFEGGSAVIVCGLMGEKLKPSRTRVRGWLANDKHSLFVGNELCVVEVTLENRKFKYVLKQLSIKAKIGIINETILWEGSREELESIKDYSYYSEKYDEDALRKFIPALEAATKKVLEYRCTQPMYILKEGEE